jgi:hypothetical protein
MSVDIAVLERSARAAGELEELGRFQPCPDRRGAIVSKLAGLGDEDELLSHTSDCAACASSLEALEQRVLGEDGSEPSALPTDVFGPELRAEDAGAIPVLDLPPLPKTRRRHVPRATRTRPRAATTPRPAPPVGRAKRDEGQDSGRQPRERKAPAALRDVGVLFGCALAVIAAVAAIGLVLSAFSGSGRKTPQHLARTSIPAPANGATTTTPLRLTAQPAPARAVARRPRSRVHASRPRSTPHRRAPRSARRKISASRPAAPSGSASASPTSTLTVNQSASPPPAATRLVARPVSQPASPPPAASPPASAPPVRAAPQPSRPASYGGGWSGDFTP